MAGTPRRPDENPRITPRTPSSIAPCARGGSGIVTPRCPARCAQGVAPSRTEQDVSTTDQRAIQPERTREPMSDQIPSGQTPPAGWNPDPSPRTETMTETIEATAP